MAALLCGCHLVFPFNPPGAPLDLGVTVDGARVDLPPADAEPPADQPWPIEAKPPPADASPADASPADASPADAPPADAPPADGPSGDLATSSTVPCGAKGQPLPTPTKWDSTKMRLCQKASSATLTQCQAAALCNAAGGWSLCEPGAYLQNGGKLEGAPIKAWLGACVRSGAASHAPTSAICGNCTYKVAGQAPVFWMCGSGIAGADTIYPYMGLLTWTACKRVGINDASTEGFWTPNTSATANTDGAVCCHP